MVVTGSSSDTSPPRLTRAARLDYSKDGDVCTIDAETNRLDVDVSEAEMAKRKAAWTAPPLKATRGTLYKYIKTVKSASEGCVTDE